jgi:hypothetical protein
MAAGVTATVEDCPHLLRDRTVAEVGAGRFLYYVVCSPTTLLPAP